MYLQISFDGRVLSTSGNPYKTVGDHVYLDAAGQLVFEIDDYGDVEYYDSSASDYERGKIRRIGGTYFYYNDYGGERGKIKSIGGVYFYYYSSYDSDYESGKLHQIGSTFLYYNTYSSYSFEQGKLHQIGSTFVYYDEDGRVKSIS